jgi:hypothetical protein
MQVLGQSRYHAVMTTVNFQMVIVTVFDGPSTCLAARIAPHAGGDRQKFSDIDLGTSGICHPDLQGSERLDGLGSLTARQDWQKAAPAFECIVPELN